MNDRDTERPEASEAEAVGTFERLIREYGESRARLAQLAVLMGDDE